MATLDAASTGDVPVFEHSTTTAPQSGMIKRAVTAVLVRYDAFAAAQEMAIKAGNDRPRLRE